MQPLPQDDGVGEGQLKPIAVAEPAADYQATLPKEEPKAAPAAQASPTAPAPSAATAAAKAAAPYQRQAPSAASTAKRPTISLSIRGIKKPAVAAETQTVVETQKRKEAYTDEAMLKAWQAYAEAHPTERILVNTMIAAKPLRIENDQYFIAVDDNIQVETILESKNDILRYLRDMLNNDYIDFEVRITQGESSPVTWTQREVLQHMINERPELKEMISTFGFALG